MYDKNTFLTERLLGVPPWFKSDGCSHVPDFKFLAPCCRRHDWDYWLGFTAETFDEGRALADKFFFSNMLHNAPLNPDGSKVGFRKRWRRRFAAVTYWRGVRRFGGSSPRTRLVRLNEDDHVALIDVAKAEGKYKEA